MQPSPDARRAEIECCRAPRSRSGEADNIGMHEKGRPEAAFSLLRHAREAAIRGAVPVSRDPRFAAMSCGAVAPPLT